MLARFMVAFDGYRGVSGRCTDLPPTVPLGGSQQCLPVTTVNLIQEEEAMATGETGFDDVTFDLISVQYHSLKAGHDYGQYVRDAENAGQDEIASFFRSVMEEDSNRAAQCHKFLEQLGQSGEGDIPSGG